MRKPRLRRIRALLRALVITLAGLEGLIRLWGYSERHIYEPIYTSFGKTGDLAYIHKPNLRQARARGLAVINTDSLGLRTKTAEASPGSKSKVSIESRSSVTPSRWRRYPKDRGYVLSSPGKHPQWARRGRQGKGL